jgi:4-hydroxy-2-oxoheptanedioate aldolase
MAAAGADFVIVDQEHGPIGPESLHAMIAATAGTTCSPWVRIAKRDDGLAKIALDAGAEGIVFPLVSTADEAADCVAMTLYPPLGRRGWGPFVAHSRWGTGLFDYAAQRGGETLCVLLIETRAAVENITDICKVEGIDCAVIAPFDLSTDLGVSGRFDAPEFVGAVAHLERHILKSRVPLGGVAMTEEATRRCMERGYRALAHGFDVLMLKQVVRQAMGWAQG